MIEIFVKCAGAAELALEELTPLQGDLKSLSSESFDKLKASLIEKGFLFPFFVWKNEETYYYLDGHQRDAVLRHMQKRPHLYRLPPKYPVVFIEAANRKEAAEAILLQSSLYGKIEGQGLQQFIQDFELEVNWQEFSQRLDFEMEFGGLQEFNGNWLGSDKDTFSGLTEADEIPEDVPTICKAGDLWQLGRHRLLCGDASNPKDAARLLGEDKVPCAITDPPYNVDINYGLYNDSQDEASYADFSRCWFEVVRKYCNTLIFTPGTGRGLANYQIWWNIQKPYWQAIWIKKNSLTHSPIGGFNSYEPIFIYGKPYKKIAQDIFEYPLKIQRDVADDKGKKLHPTPKQIALWCALVETFTNPEDRLLDPFSGSGTSFIAAEQTKRICYGLEIDPHYCDVIIGRWENFTGGKAHLISSVNDGSNDIVI